MLSCARQRRGLPEIAHHAALCVTSPYAEYHAYRLTDADLSQVPAGDVGPGELHLAGAGADQIDGGYNDAIYAGHGDDVIYGGLFAFGDRGNDLFEGGEGSQDYVGGDGIDSLYGGYENTPAPDFLHGGANRDGFGLEESMGIDTVMDFSKADNDRIVFALADFNNSAHFVALASSAGDPVLLDHGDSFGSFSVEVTADYLAIEIAPGHELRVLNITELASSDVLMFGDYGAI